MVLYHFEWDEEKNSVNQKKHNVSFEKAQSAFYDDFRIIFKDVAHSDNIEQRYYCLGRVDDDILTVRFTMRHHIIRIIGAGYWRKGKKYYEQENNLHR